MCPVLRGPGFTCWYVLVCLLSGCSPVGVFVDRLFTCWCVCWQAVHLLVCLLTGCSPVGVFVDRLFSCWCVCWQAVHLLICVDVCVLSGCWPVDMCWCVCWQAVHLLVYLLTGCSPVGVFVDRLFTCWYVLNRVVRLLTCWYVSVCVLTGKFPGWQACLFWGPASATVVCTPCEPLHQTEMLLPTSRCWCMVSLLVVWKTSVDQNIVQRDIYIHHLCHWKRLL